MVNTEIHAQRKRDFNRVIPKWMLTTTDFRTGDPILTVYDNEDEPIRCYLYDKNDNLVGIVFEGNDIAKISNRTRVHEYKIGSAKPLSEDISGNADEIAIVNILSSEFDVDFFGRKIEKRLF